MLSSQLRRIVLFRSNTRGAAIATAMLGTSLLVWTLANAEDVYLREEGTLLHLGNDLIELKIDRSTGFFRDIHNKVTGIHHKASEDSGSWPYGMRLGSPRWPDLLRVEINAEALHPQRMRYQIVPDTESKTLQMSYDELVTTGGTPSGVHMTVLVTLRERVDYLLIRADLGNHGSYEITNFFSGGDELIAAPQREDEVLAVPGWDYGKLWSNPFHEFAERETFGYPIFGSNAGLDAGWMDLYGPEGGIGIGYLNQQGLSMLFNVERGKQGMRLNWQLFNLIHEKATRRWTSVGGVYGLEPGQEFSTNTWILAAHEGDWHRMADIYRREYEKAFAGDYLTWDRTSEIAKQVDLTSVYTILNVRRKAPYYGEEHRFEEIPLFVSELLDKTQIQPKNLLVGFLGHSPHWPLYMPDFMPCCEEGGGMDACRQMIDDLREMGIQAIQFYAHLFYNHPKANDYVLQADTAYDHQNMIWQEIGNVANVADKAWQNLWRMKYMPGYRDLGVTGVFLDQGPTQYLVPPIDDAENVEMLGAHVKGVRQLLAEFRKGYGDRPLYFWTEVGSDLQTRDVDIWTTGGSYARGGRVTPEVVRHTFPYRLSVQGAPSTVIETNRALVNGFALSMPSKMNEALSDAIRQFVKVRKGLRESKAPGFPHGFRDTVGLSFDDSLLLARSYADQNGITVLYAARSDVDTTIEVDKSTLHRGAGIERISVELREGQAGFTYLK